MWAALRFCWRLTRGYRLRPWRSPLVRWRVETYSGLEAATLTRASVLRFSWRERAALRRFLRWTASMEQYRRQGHRMRAAAEAGPAPVNWAE
ncbi:MAG: hypothetical protein ACRD01_04005 [Terriglobales bacterium]